MVMGTDRTLAAQLQSPPGASPLQGPSQHRWAHVCGSGRSIAMDMPGAGGPLKMSGAATTPEVQYFKSPEHVVDSASLRGHQSWGHHGQGDAPTWASFCET